MTRHARFALGVGALVLASVTLISGLDVSGRASRMLVSQGAIPHHYFVDFERGSDRNNGLDAQSAWRHAPGDPAADSGAAQVRLGPGDIVTFAAGSIYRGQIAVTASGTATAPIIFEGGDGAPAIIDGSDPVAVRPCPDAAACGGAANWMGLHLMRGTGAFQPDVALFAAGRALRPAREPDPTVDFYRDEVADMAEVDGTALSRGEVRLPGLPDRASGLNLALWVRPNLVIERPVLRVESGTAFFDPSGLDFYRDRPSRAALVNSIAAIDQPGEYVVLPGAGTVVGMLPAGVAIDDTADQARGSDAVTAASGRGGFQLQGASHITIRNLSFRQMSDGGEQFDGIAVFSNRRGNRGITLTGNHFHDMVMARGQGPIILRGVAGVTITANRIERITAGSGIRISGPGDGVLVRDNYIRQVGRTAIVLMNVVDGMVRDNLIIDVSGVHGNGLTAYLANRRVSFIGNTVVNAKQPLTFHGDGSGAPNDLVFANNLLIGTEGALGSLISWGRTTRNVTIRNNLVFGGRFGLRLNPGDQAVVATGNQGTDMVVTGVQPSGWLIRDNRWRSMSGDEVRRISDWAERGRATALPDSASLTGFCVDRGMAARTPRGAGASEGGALAAGDDDGRIGANFNCATLR